MLLWTGGIQLGLAVEYMLHLMSEGSCECLGALCRVWHRSAVEVLLWTGGIQQGLGVEFMLRSIMSERSWECCVV